MLLEGRDQGVEENILITLRVQTPCLPRKSGFLV